MNTTVLVTGGAGFIGSNCVKRLLGDSKHVICLDNFNTYYDPAIKRRNISGFLEQENFSLFEGDILDGAMLEEIFSGQRVGAVIHLAARAGVRPSLSEPVLYETVNVVGTLNLLEAARKHKVENFVFGSSSSVYGINSKTPFSEEDRIEHPVSPYATSKRAAELYCYNYSHLYGLPITCLRFFTVYGPRQRPEMAIHKFTRLIDEGEPIPTFGDGSSARDYTYIDDIVSGIMAALEQPVTFEIYNLGNSRTTTLSRMITLISTALGKEAKLNWLPAQAGDVPITFADIEKAQTKLGYKPATPIEEGITKFVDWYNSSKLAIKK